MIESFVGSLPWLVVHGPTLGLSLLATGILGGALTGACWTRAAARLLAIWQCARLGPPLRQLDPRAPPRWAVVQGVMRFVDGRRCVEMGDGTLVELCGATRGYLRRGHGPFVVAGDRVRVAGVLEHAESSSAGGYRESKGCWRMVADGAALEIVLFAPRAVIGSPAWRACSALAGAASAAVLLTLTMELAGRLGAGDVARLAAGERAWLSEIAAADPGWRLEALQRLEDGYRARLEGQGEAASNDVVDGVVALAVLRGDCGGAAALLLERGRPAQAAGLAAECSGSQTREAEAMAAYQLGSFVEASKAWELAQVSPQSPDDAIWWPRARASLRAHILAERFETASREAQRFAAVTVGTRRQHLLCLASALGEAAFDESHQPHPVIAARGSLAHELGCWRSRDADGFGHWVVGNWLVSLSDAAKVADAAHGQVQRQVWAAPAIPVPTPEDLLSAPSGGLRGMAPALEEELLRRLDTQTTVPARVAAARLALRRAAFEALAGAPHQTDAAGWLALTRHRVNEARALVERLQEGQQVVAIAIGEPKRWRRLCSGHGTPPEDALPAVPIVSPEMALWVAPPADDEAPLPPAFLGLGADGPDTAQQALSTLQDTRAAIRPLEEGIRRLISGPPAPRDAALAARPAMWRLPTWEMGALEAMRHHAALGASESGNAMRPRTNARLAARRFHDALRATDVGLLTGVLDSL